MSVPEIPGYRLVGEPRRGDMATVYPAIQAGRRRNSPVKFLVLAASLALIIGGAGWFLLQVREGKAPALAAPEESIDAVPAASEETGDAAPKTPEERIGSAAEAVEPPRPDIAALLDRGGALLASGDLVTPADANALDHYRQALELAPDRKEARAGIEAVGRALAEQGRVLLAEGDATAARERLERAEDLASGTPEVVGLAGALAARAASGSLAQWIREQMEAGNLTTPEVESAVALVRRGLEGPAADRVAPLRDELVARLEEIAAEAREFDLDEAARPYAEAARELASLGVPEKGAQSRRSTPR